MNKIFFTFILSALLSYNINSQFVPTSGPSGGAVYCMFTSGDILYAGTQNGGVFKTTDHGDSWINLNNGMGTPLIYCLTGTGNTVLAGTNTGLYRSLDGGANWSLINYGVASWVKSITVNGSDIYLGNDAGKIYKSVNNGTNWTLFANNMTGEITSILFHNGIIYAAASMNGVYASSNGGANWQFENVGYLISVLYPTGNVIRLGTGNGGKKNTNPMGGWVQDIQWINYVKGYASVGTYIIAGMSTGMFWSSNNGATWNDPIAGYIFGAYVHSMGQNSEYVFAGLGSVYRRPASQFTGLNTLSTNVPDEFSLSQNYPNPFNPGTNIKFGIPKSANIILSVYNQLGESVAVLVNQKLEAGEYEYYFDASNLSSGVYYYKLIAGDQTSVKKMILIK
jgi:hypothetical protein